MLVDVPEGHSVFVFPTRQDEIAEQYEAAWDVERGAEEVTSAGDLGVRLA